MAVTPVGPFCPFRSSAAQAVDSHMDRFSTSATPELARELSSIQQDIQVGNIPDDDRMLRLSNIISEAVDQWESLMTRLRISPDFQTREYAKLTQAHLEKYGMSIESIASMMRWQSEFMKSLAYDRPPPMPPTNIDLAKMVQWGSNTAAPSPSLAAMTSAKLITSNPFTGDEAAFESPTVKEEYQRLCRDHAKLIEFGANYESFDPLGKLAYIDEIEKVQERWDIFFTRFSLMGVLSKNYIAQCDTFLASMGMKEADYRQLLKDCHDIMRKDAERERNLLGL